MDKAMLVRRDTRSSIIMLAAVMVGEDPIFIECEYEVYVDR